jgi:hypothetical protein
MAILRRFLKSLAGRNYASRGGKGGSHVNKKANKRAYNKACRRAQCICECDGTAYDEIDPQINGEQK